MKALAAALLLAAAPQDARIEAHFSPSGERRALHERIEKELAGARREVLVALFHFTSDRLAGALAARRRAGADVRLLLDAAQADPAFVDRLRNARVDVRLVRPRGDEFARFHHKYAVLDEATVITGSFNWTWMADARSHENLLVLRDAPAARAYREDFLSTWNDRALSPP
jgi:phosphatidylserine/phosphatidylglycerophosphate/cardiolipin synthase-like enzyme